MKIVFMGTPEFAVPSLEALIQHHEVIGVVSQPDRPKGRGKKLVPTPVKACALAHQIPVFQPDSVKEESFQETLRSLQPDLIAVVAFGQILPVDILNIPPYGCINVHGSLLPFYRGAAPMQWAVINAEEKTGVTTMYMTKGLDSGDMLLKAEIPLTSEDTYGSVHDKLSTLGADLLIQTIAGLEKQEITPIPQNHEISTYAPMITKELCHIDWSKSAEEIVHLIHGLSPVPGAYTCYGEEKWKIWNGEAIVYQGQEVPGQIISVSKKDFMVMTGNGALKILELQGSGGKRMSTDAYLRGHEIQAGVLLQ